MLYCFSSAAVKLLQYSAYISGRPADMPNPLLSVFYVVIYTVQAQEL